ncbi:hypothetical protein EDB89DRAFT_1900916 [Lactarius sanguifluus]|nr:hypothetical protein EDB89DRAFT_1900916 [Lactarius sanguifluus]
MDPSTLETIAIASDAIAVAPYVLSDWERTTYYNGISPDHPKLLYRSDLLENPFPIPKGRHPHLPTKTAYGVFNTPLNAVWDTVAPQICDHQDKTARFVTHGEDGKDTLGPVVIWIATHPTTTTAENAHDASPDILALLKANGVEGASVEWYEGAVEKIVRSTPSACHRRYQSHLLCPSIAHCCAWHAYRHCGREAADAQGSVTLFFHENKDKRGAPSAKVFGVSNCHVLREDTTVEYEFKGAGAPPQNVRLAGFRRFQRGLDEIKACVGGYRTDADLLAREIVGLEAKPKSEDPEEEAEDEAAMEAKLEKLVKTLTPTGVILRAETLATSIGPPRSPSASRVKDIGTFEVDAARFKAQFKGNVVDLGDKFTSRQLTNMFYPQSAGRTVFKFPMNRQLRINGCQRGACLIVMKDGNTTDLTVGRYADLEAYLRDDLGVESIELAIYNYDKQSGPFSANGDSGSLIFDGEGHMVGILHSGMPKGGSNHVTYVTPAWWAIEQLKLEYPHADFNRIAF